MKVRFSPLDKLGCLNLKKIYSADEKLVLRLFKGWPNTKRVSPTICEDLHRVNLSGHQQIAHFLARVAYLQSVHMCASLTCWLLGLQTNHTSEDLIVQNFWSLSSNKYHGMNIGFLFLLKSTTICVENDFAKHWGIANIKYKLIWLEKTEIN